MYLLTALLLFSSVLFGNDLFTDIRACSPHLEQLIAEGQIVEMGSDDLRVKYVQAQGCIEQLLARKQASGEITDLVGIIHTPLPATPLCAKPEGPFPSVVDPEKRNTVLSRAQILRDYLAIGAKLYIAYPKGGLEKRTAEQQEIYREALSQFPNLIDWPLATDFLEPEMIGATYLFRNTEGELYAFSIKARQVNDMQLQTEWGMWFGPLVDAKISTRIDPLLDYLSSIGGPPL